MNPKQLQKLWTQCRKGKMVACKKYSKAIAREKYKKLAYKQTIDLMSEYKKERKAHPTLSSKVVMQIAKDHLKEEY